MRWWADGVGEDSSWDWSGLTGTTYWAHDLLLMFSCARLCHQLCQESPGGNCCPGVLGQRPKTPLYTRPHQIWLLEASCKRLVHLQSGKRKPNNSLLWTCKHKSCFLNLHLDNIFWLEIKLSRSYYMMSWSEWNLRAMSICTSWKSGSYFKTILKVFIYIILEFISILSFAVFVWHYSNS